MYIVNNNFVNIFIIIYRSYLYKCYQINVYKYYLYKCIYRKNKNIETSLT